MSDAVFTWWEVQFQYRPGQWTTQGSFGSEQEALKNMVNHEDWRVVRVESFLVKRGGIRVGE